MPLMSCLLNTNAALLFCLSVILPLFLSSRVIRITGIERIVLQIAENSFILRGETDLIDFNEVLA